MTRNVAGTMTTEAVEREEIERWFIKRGLPHFIDGYSAGTDIWTRSLPVLGVAYLAGGFNALDLANWSLRRNLGAAAVTLAVLIAGIAVANVLRGRPALSIPRAVGPGELALFVIGPSLPALLPRPARRRPPIDVDRRRCPARDLSSSRATG